MESRKLPGSDGQTTFTRVMCKGQQKDRDKTK